MSYTTNQDDIFAGLGQGGINTILSALFKARPRYLNYATPGLAPGQTVDVTQLPDGPFGLEYSVAFSPVTVDITPPDTVYPPGLSPGADQFVLVTQATLTFVPSTGANIVSKITLYALCQPTVVSTSPSAKAIGIRLVMTAVTGVQPDALAAFLANLLFGFLKQALDNAALPLGSLTGTVSFILDSGPTAEDDYLELLGNVV